MAERLKALVLKTKILFTISWVRIPLHPYNVKKTEKMKKILALKSHLTDLRIKTFYLILSYIVTFVICFGYRVNILLGISKFFVILNKKFIFTKISTGFWVYLKLSMITALILIIPIFIYFLILFLLKGIFTYQIKIFSFITVISFLFIGGALSLLYNYLFPYILFFFLSFESKLEVLTITLEARLDQYLNFVIFFFLSMLILLFVPMLLLFIHLYFKSNISIRKQLYIPLIFCFILFAPPDIMIQLFVFPFFIVFSEILLLVTMILKYFMQNINEESRIRTYDENISTDLQSAAFNHSAISSKKG